MARLASTRLYLIALALICGLLLAATPKKAAPPEKAVPDVAAKPLPQPKNKLFPIEKIANPKLRDSIARYRTAKDEGGGPLKSFKVGAREFKYTGTVVSRTTIFAPVAVLVAPPFEKIFRTSMRAEVIIGGHPIGHKFRERNRYDDLMPVSVAPEQVYTSFGMGESTSIGNTVGSGISTSWTVGAKAGIDIMGIGTTTEIKLGVENEYATEHGEEIGLECETVAGLEGWNWTLADLAKVFAVQATFDSYAYAPADDPGRILWINVPVYSVGRLYGLDEWNAEATRINQDETVTEKVPTFAPTVHWWIGNVATYPTLDNAWCMVNADAGTGPIGGSTRLIATSTSGAYIDREGASLHGSMSLSRQTFDQCSKVVGATSQFSVEAEVEGSGGSIEHVATVKQSYMHQMTKGSKFTMEFQTSGVAPLLDGGDGSLCDFHFVLLPRLHRIVTVPSGTFARNANVMSRVVRSLHSEAERKATVLGAELARKLTGIEVKNLTVSSEHGMVVGGMPLVDLMLDNDIGVDGTSSVLVCQFATTDLGKSYEDLANHAGAWLLVHHYYSNLLRRIAAGALLAEAMSNQGLVIATPYAPGFGDRQIVIAEPQWKEWMDDQLTQWVERGKNRKNEMRDQMAVWVDSLPEYSFEASRMAQVSVEARHQMQDLATRMRQSVDRFEHLTLSAEAGDRFKKIEPGYYTLNHEIFDPAKPAQPNMRALKLEATTLEQLRKILPALSTPNPRATVVKPVPIAKPKGGGPVILEGAAVEKPKK